MADICPLYRGVFFRTLGFIFRVSDIGVVIMLSNTICDRVDVGLYDFDYDLALVLALALDSVDVGINASVDVVRCCVRHRKWLENERKRQKYNQDERKRQEDQLRKPEPVEQYDVPVDYNVSSGMHQAFESRLDRILGLLFESDSGL